MMNRPFLFVVARLGVGAFLPGVGPLLVYPGTWEILLSCIGTTLSVSYRFRVAPAEVQVSGGVVGLRYLAAIPVKGVQL